jgi:hypothetical protein
MTTEYRGQTDVMRWCGGVTRNAILNWFTRHPDEVPQPDVIILNEGTDQVTRGWLPERRREWEKFAAARRSEPGEAGRAAARRARTTAALIEQGVAAGAINPAEGVKLLAALIGQPENRQKGTS